MNSEKTNLKHMKKLYILILVAMMGFNLQAQQVNMDLFKSMKTRNVGPAGVVELLLLMQ